MSRISKFKYDKSQENKYSTQGINILRYSLGKLNLIDRKHYQMYFTFIYIWVIVFCHNITVNKKQLDLNKIDTTFKMFYYLQIFLCENLIFLMKFKERIKNKSHFFKKGF
jgi:hypothetical protein